MEAKTKNTSLEFYEAVRLNDTAQALQYLDSPVSDEDGNDHVTFVDPENSANWTPLHWACYHGMKRWFIN